MGKLVSERFGNEVPVYTAGSCCTYTKEISLGVSLLNSLPVNDIPYGSEILGLAVLILEAIYTYIC